MNNYHIYD
jgi:serine/threonine-protein kinase ULK4